MQCSAGFKYDPPISDCHFEWDKKKALLKIHLGYKGELSKEIKEDGLHIYKKGTTINAQLINRTSLASSLLQVKIIYHNTPKTAYAYSFILALAEPKSHYQLALDIGSDTTQSAFKQGKSSKTVYVDLLEELKVKYGYPAKEKQQFLQAGPRQNEERHPLFVSSFFWKNGEEPLPAARPNSSNPVQIIVPKDKKLEGLSKLPNLKLVSHIPEKALASKTKKPIEEQLYDSLQLSIISQLLQASLYKIVRRSAEQKAAKIGIVLTLIIPNIYHQQKINQLIKSCYQLIATIKSYEEFAAILDIEVQTIAESDATFKGDFANRQALGTFATDISPKRSLVINGGKASLDLSILKQVDRHQNFLCEYRTGIVGAGQLLSFATLESYLDQLNLDLPSFIKMLNGKEMGAQSRTLFWQKLETLKKAARFSTKQKDSHFPKPQTFPELVENLQAFIDQKGCLPADKMRTAINICCSKICQRLKDKHEKIPFDKVILAGQVFRFGLLRNTLKTALLEEGLIPDKRVVSFDHSIAKRVCLEGVLTSACHIDFNTDFAGGLILHEVQQPEVQNSWQNGLTSFLLGNPGELKPQIIRRNIPFDRNFLLGIGKDNALDLSKTSKIYFFIGNKNYTPLGLADRLKHSTDLRLNLEQEGFVLRFPDQTNIPLVYNKPINKEEEFVLKSIFPDCNMESLLSTNPGNLEWTVKNYFQEGPKNTVNLFSQEKITEKQVNLFNN